MANTTVPTKGNLLAVKKTLQLSRTGFELLDRKRNILIREMMQLIDRANEIQSKIDDTYTAAYAALQTANITLGICRDWAYTVPIDNGLTVAYRSVMGVKIPDQCGQRSPYIMGKTGHELSVGFIRPAERGQLFLVGGDDLIDFIGDRRGKLVRRGQNAPVAIPRSDILKRVKHFLQPRFYTPDYQNADQNGSGGSYD